MITKRIILWGGWYGSKNVGDQALLLSITDLLGEMIEHAEFVVITDNPAQVLENTKRDSAHTFLPLHTRGQFLGIVKAFTKADMFIFGGGVPFYDDWLHSAAIAVLVTLSRMFRVPCVLWSVSSQRIRSSLTRLTLRYLLSAASVITYRDLHTGQLFRECGANDKHMQLTPDSAFSLRLNDKQQAREILERAGWSLEHSRPLVALTPRLLRGSDGEAHIHYQPQAVSDRHKEIDVFATILDWLWESGYQPIFVPMNTVMPDDDRVASQEIVSKAKYGKHALLIDEQINPRDAANVYHFCEAAFVSRVHGAVTAFLGGCPILMYAFDLKHGGIMEQMELSDYIFNPKSESPIDAVRMLDEILQSRSRIIAQMEKKARGVNEQVKVQKEAVFALLKE